MISNLLIGKVFRVHPIAVKGGFTKCTLRSKDRFKSYFLGFGRYKANS